MSPLSPRLKTEIRVAAHLRRAQAAGAFATVVKRGDPDAGAIAVKIYAGADHVQLLVQGRDLDGNEVWRSPFDVEDGAASTEKDVDAWLEKECRFDSDLWIIEIEDGEGRSFLE